MSEREKLINIEKMIDVMVNLYCYRSTEHHQTLKKIDFKMFALLKIFSSEKYKDLDLEKDKSYIFKMIKNDINDNVDKYAMISKPRNRNKSTYKKKESQRLFLDNLLDLNYKSPDILDDGKEAIINQIGKSNYDKLLNFSTGRKLKSAEARRIRKKINIDLLMKEIEW